MPSGHVGMMMSSNEHHNQVLITSWKLFYQIKFTLFTIYQFKSALFALYYVTQALNSFLFFTYLSFFLILKWHISCSYNDFWTRKQEVPRRTWNQLQLATEMWVTSLALILFPPTSTNLRPAQPTAKQMGIGKSVFQHVSSLTMVKEIIVWWVGVLDQYGLSSYCLSWKPRCKISVSTYFTGKWWRFSAAS